MIPLTYPKVSPKQKQKQYRYPFTSKRPKYHQPDGMKPILVCHESNVYYLETIP